MTYCADCFMCLDNDLEGPYPCPKCGVDLCCGCYCPFCDKTDEPVFDHDDDYGYEDESELYDGG